jgi:aspartate racemase
MIDKKKRLGILAGMGPRSTTPFLELVYDECQSQYKAKYDIDYPEIVVYSWPTPFYLDREINDEQMFKAIKNGLLELQKNNVDIIAIPCNTAHKYFDQLEKYTTSKLLNIIEIAIDKMGNNSEKVTVLATKPTMDMNLYQNAIIHNGKEYYFENRWQADVNDLIMSIKAKDDYRNICNRYKELENKIQRTGIDTIILACTDLAVIKDKDRAVRVIDSSKELARELIREYLIE